MVSAYYPGESQCTGQISRVMDDASSPGTHEWLSMSMSQSGSVDPPDMRTSQVHEFLSSLFSPIYPSDLVMLVGGVFE